MNEEDGSCNHEVRDVLIGQGLRKDFERDASAPVWGNGLLWAVLLFWGMLEGIGYLFGTPTPNEVIRALFTGKLFPF